MDKVAYLFLERDCLIKPNRVKKEALIFSMLNADLKAIDPALLIRLLCLLFEVARCLLYAIVAKWMDSLFFVYYFFLFFYLTD